MLSALPSYVPASGPVPEGLRLRAMELIGALIPLALLGLYFPPTFIAARKSKANATAIVMLNLFLGWTFVGWVVSLV